MQLTVEISDLTSLVTPPRDGDMTVTLWLHGGHLTVANFKKVILHCQLYIAVMGVVAPSLKTIK